MLYLIEFGQVENFTSIYIKASLKHIISSKYSGVTSWLLYIICVVCFIYIYTFIVAYYYYYWVHTIIEFIGCHLKLYFWNYMLVDQQVINNTIKSYKQVIKF